MVAENKDIVFYLKLFPLVSIHPEAYEKSKAIVCEPSNQKGLEMLVAAYQKQPLPKPTCETDIVDRTLNLGQSMGITGTPAIILQNGRKLSGALPADKLVEAIKEATAEIKK